MSIHDTSYQFHGSDLDLIKQDMIKQDLNEPDLNESDLYLNEPDLNKIKAKTKLIVNYLPQSTTEGELRILFSTIGAVESANVIRDKMKGHSLQYGFVSYVDPCDAGKAIGALNRHQLQDKVIKVSYARPSSEAIQDANIYVCNLPKTMSLEGVEQMFAPYGRIINSRMLMDAEGKPRGAAFIRFDKRAEAQEATRQMNGHKPPGASEGIRISKPILCKGPDSKGKGADAKGKGPGCHRKVSQQLPKAAKAGLTSGSGQGRHQQSSVLFIHNLDPDTDEDLLSNMFSNFGTVADVRVIRDFRTNKCRGLAFVTMSNYDEAINAISGLNGFRVGENTLQVSFGKVDGDAGRSRERAGIFRPYDK